MPLYSDFWQTHIKNFTDQFTDPKESFELRIPNSGIAQIGDRPGSGFNGYLHVFAMDVRKHTKSQVFRDLAKVIKDNRKLRDRIYGLLEVRISDNDIVNFKYEPFSWEMMMNRYRDYQDDTQSEAELFKWEQVQHFQNLWEKYKNKELSFQDALLEVRWDQMVFHSAPWAFKLFVEKEPEAYEKALLGLYDESIGLQKRINSFVETITALYEPYKTEKARNHYHDERTIATLLAYRYPEKYTFYMDKFYGRLAKCLGMKPKPVNQKLLHYYELVEVFRSSELPKYQDVISANNSFIDDSKYYPDNEHQILTQDIFYVTLTGTGNDEEDEEVDQSEFQQVVAELDPEFYEFYLKHLREIVSHFKLSTEDKRIAFTVAPSDTRLSLIVNNRLAFAIQNKSGGTELLFITQELVDGLRYDTFYDYKKDIEGYLMKSRTLSDIKDHTTQIKRAVQAELDRNFSSPKHHLNNQEFIDEIYKDIAMANQDNRHDLNTILFGPPGTGKTYNTIDVAVEIIEGEKEDHETNKIRFDELISSGQVLFTTFHQSMTYEDFVEGIKPETQDGEVTYEVKSGIFKLACARAAHLCQRKYNSIKGQSEYDFDIIYNEFIDSIRPQILLGDFPVYQTINGKEVEIFEINTQDSIKARSKGSSATNVAPLTQGNLEKLYNKFDLVSEITSLSQVRDTVEISPRITEFYAVFGGIKEFENNVKPLNEYHEEEGIDKSTDEDKLRKFTDGVYNEAIRESGKSANPVVLIIDEINRGNVSQIFGELITLLEPDKRYGNDESLELLLPYSKSKFSVPPNLYIVGTMNTADRSVEALDTALRRRFSFEEMPPRPKLLSPGAFFHRLLWKKEYREVDWEDEPYRSKEQALFDILGASSKIRGQYRKDKWDEMEKEGVDAEQIKHFPDHEFDGLNLQLLLTTLNDRIEKLLDKDHMIGHSYFMSVLSYTDLQDAFANKIIPLLQEYFYGDAAKIGLIIGSHFFEEPKSKKVDDFFFAKFDHEALPELKERTVLRLKNVGEMKDDEFKTAIDMLLNKVKPEADGADS